MRTFCALLWFVTFPISSRGSFHNHGVYLIPAWISNPMPSKVWFGKTYLFPNFNGCIGEIWEWISNFIPHFVIDVITHPCLAQSQSMSVKGDPGLWFVTGHFTYIRHDNFIRAGAISWGISVNLHLLGSGSKNSTTLKQQTRVIISWDILYKFNELPDFLKNSTNTETFKRNYRIYKSLT